MFKVGDRVRVKNRPFNAETMAHLFNGVVGTIDVINRDGTGARLITSDERVMFINLSELEPYVEPDKPAPAIAWLPSSAANLTIAQFEMIEGFIRFLCSWADSGITLDYVPADSHFRETWCIASPGIEVSKQSLMLAVAAYVAEANKRMAKGG